MRLTRAGEYGVRCISYMADIKPGTVVKRREIAEAMDIPLHFLGKIAQTLSKSGIIRITQGAKGGFVLLHKADELSLLEVIEAMEGKITLNDCVLKPGDCEMSQVCAVHEVWIEAQQKLRQTLDSVTFSDLAKKGKHLKQVTQIVGKKK